LDLVIFDFDRCDGVLRNPYRMHFDTAAFMGAAISPNSRFLYFANGWRVIQYDLESFDIKSSETTVAIWDYFSEMGLPTGFYLMQLGPDGKIYISSSGATSWMHYIDKPNEKGLACDVRQRGIKLPTYNAWTMPNHPNYRLGALKGSPCDTLHSIAVKEKGASLQATLFPNPASEQVTIKWQNDEGEAYEVIIIDAVGRLVQRQELHASSLTLDTSSWANGLYYVQIVEEKGRRKAFLKMAKNN
jgi:hypothetical protein